MDTSELLAALRRDGDAFVASCLAADPTTTIEACPEWRPMDLLWHLTEVHHFWGSVARQRATDPGQVVGAVRPDDDRSLAGMYRTGLDDLLATLTDADQEAEVWTWASRTNIGFITRRMAQETAVHRWDADHAAGLDRPIEAFLASDGIDEFLTHFTIRRRDGATLDGSVHLHCTDVPGEWTTRAVGDALVTVAEHAKGECALRGPADLLLRALWRRASIDDLDVIGNAAVGAQLLAYTALG